MDTIIYLRGVCWAVNGVLFFTAGIVSLRYVFSDVIERVGNHTIRYGLSILFSLVLFVLISIAVYISIWTGQQKGLVAGLRMLFIEGVVLSSPWLVLSLIKYINRGKISNKQLWENSHLMLNTRGVHSIAKIIELEEISAHSYWVTYEFFWKDVRYTNKIARSGIRKNGAFDRYELDRLFFVLLMKKDPSNNILTENLVPQTKKLTLTEEDVPKNGWKREEYMQFLGQ